MLRCRSFRVPKKGNSESEYEDAAVTDTALGRFAIADGASESVFAGEWAGLLCQSYVSESPDPTKLVEWRQSLQKRWLAMVLRQELPWYLEEKLKEGAYATFLGLSLGEQTPTHGRAWKALAIGDSCLFHVRGARLLTAFPLEQSEDFGTRPNLIGSRQRSEPTGTVLSGTIEPGDALLMMTDALAEWFLRTCDEGGVPWAELLRLRESDFPHWVDGLRDSLLMKNDDVTVIVLEM